MLTKEHVGIGKSNGPKPFKNVAEYTQSIHSVSREIDQRLNRVLEAVAGPRPVADQNKEALISLTQCLDETLTNVDSAMSKIHQIEVILGIQSGVSAHV